MSGTLFNAQFGLKPALVAYRGTTPALNDLVGGQIDYMVDQSLNVIPQIKGGTIKVYAIAAVDAARKPARRAHHQGSRDRLHLQRLERAWLPRRARPKEIIDKLAAALSKALDDPATRKRYVDLGSTAPDGAERGPAAMQKLVESEMARITPVLKKRRPPRNEGAMGSDPPLARHRVESLPLEGLPHGARGLRTCG